MVEELAISSKSLFAVNMLPNGTQRKKRVFLIISVLLPGGCLENVIILL
jgi:hypothetical protein